jgi:hypothetical protein
LISIIFGIPWIYVMRKNKKNKKLSSNRACGHVALHLILLDCFLNTAKHCYCGFKDRGKFNQYSIML